VGNRRSRRREGPLARADARAALVAAAEGGADATAAMMEVRGVAVCDCIVTSLSGSNTNCLRESPFRRQANLGGDGDDGDDGAGGDGALPPPHAPAWRRAADACDARRVALAAALGAFEDVSARYRVGGASY